jgi:hypothetical protein
VPGRFQRDQSGISFSKPHKAIFPHRNAVSVATYTQNPLIQ